MKHFYILGILLISLSLGNQAKSQNVVNKSTTEKTDIQAFKKGKFQIGLQDLSLGLYGYGGIFASADLRFGYFIADNNLVFINSGFSNWGINDFHAYNLGLNYRKYFGSFHLKPFAQVGYNKTWNIYNDVYNDITYKSQMNEFKLGGGIQYQIKRLGFELGSQLIYNTNSLDLAPFFGISFTF